MRASTDMPNHEIQTQLNRLFADRAFAKFLRAIPGSEILHGFVLGKSSSLVLLQVVREFHLDGYSIVRVRDLEGVLCRREEKFFQKMLKAEGVVPDEATKAPALGSMASALKSLSRRAGIVSIECETPDDDEFYAGTINGVAGRTAKVRTFDVLGKWDAKPEMVDVRMITLVSWDTEYLRVFAKHVAK
jgi:hypothetical protein